MTFKIQQEYWGKTAKEKNTVDYVYWSNKGWIDPHREFYIEHKSNTIKVGFARLIGKVISMFIR